MRYLFAGLVCFMSELPLAIHGPKHFSRDFHITLMLPSFAWSCNYFSMGAYRIKTWVLTSLTSSLNVLMIWKQFAITTCIVSGVVGVRVRCGGSLHTIKPCNILRVELYIPRCVIQQVIWISSLYYPELAYWRCAYFLSSVHGVRVVVIVMSCHLFQQVFFALCRPRTVKSRLVTLRVWR